MSEGRYERMARELARCRADLNHAIGHMTTYISLLDRDSPPESFLLGRMTSDLQALSRMSDDLDNVVDLEEGDE